MAGALIVVAASLTAHASQQDAMGFLDRARALQKRGDAAGALDALEGFLSRVPPDRRLSRWKLDFMV